MCHALLSTRLHDVERRSEASSFEKKTKEDSSFASPSGSASCPAAAESAEEVEDWEEDWAKRDEINEKPTKSVVKRPPPRKEEIRAALGWLVDELVTVEQYSGRPARKHVYWQLERAIRDPTVFNRCYKSEACREHVGWLRHFLDRYYESLRFVYSIQ
jgi:hypothetical protein